MRPRAEKAIAVAWSLTLKNGRMSAAHAGKVVLEDIALFQGEGASAPQFAVEPYGMPYEAAAPAGAHVIAHFSLVPPTEPAQRIILEVGCGPTRVYFRLYPFPPKRQYTLRAAVRWGEEPYLCRTKCGAGDPSATVVQAGLGPVESLLCDCLFDKWTDRLIRFQSDDDVRIRKDPATGSFFIDARVTATFGAVPDLLSVEVTDHFVTEILGMPHYRPYDRTHHPVPPSGWESWYCYGPKTSEELLVTVTDWLAIHLKPFGCKVVQWDDGYQGESWLEWKRDLFPKGPKWIADFIRSRGFTPGIWVVPQSLGNVDSKYLVSSPDWILKGGDGKPFRAFGNYPYVDPTRPDVKREWFEKIFRTMAAEWGIDFFKIDGQGEMQQWYALCRDRLFDPSVTPDDAYREFLRIIRTAIGPERTLLICATQWRAMGLGDACRTGTDVGERWPAAEPALQATFSQYWMHTIAWYNDPDVLMVRPTLTLDQARAWSSLLGLSGQVLLNSDPVHELPEERVELLRRVFPAQDIRPMDLWPRPPHGPYPQVWDLKVARAWGSWDVVGLFRWYGENKEEVGLTAETLGLAPGRYVLYDVWEKAFLGELGEGRTFRLKPESCKVVCVRPLSGIPLLLGTSRHITQGYADLDSLRCDGNVLSGESVLVGGDSYEIRILVELDGQELLFVRATAPGTEVVTHREGPVRVVTLKSTASMKVCWRVEFKAMIQAERANPSIVNK